MAKVLAKMEVCEHCAFGKQKWVSFDTDIHKAKDTLDYIHFDLCAPSPVPSKGRHCYMLTIIDFLMKSIG